MMILRVLSCILIFSLEYWLLSLFFKQRRVSILYKALGVFIAGVILSVVNTFSSPILNTLCSFSLGATLAVIFFEGKIRHRIIGGFAAEAVGVSCEFAQVAFLSLLSGQNVVAVTNKTVSSVFASLIGAGIQCLVILFVRQIILLKKKRHRCAFFSPNPIVLILPVFSILFSYYILLKESSRSTSSESVWADVAMLICLFLMNVLILVADNRSYQEHEAQAKLLELSYRTMLNEQTIHQQEENLVQMEMAAHDYCKHLTSLQHIVKENLGSNDVVESTFSQAIDAASNRKGLYAFGSQALTTIINRYVEKASKQELEFHVAVQYDDFDFMTFPDVCSLFTNVLDNAFEAVSQVKGNKPDKWVSLQIYRKNHLIFIELQNSMMATVKKDGDRYLTTKHIPKGHGLGIKNIERIVKKYDGSLYLENTSSVFSLYCSIPILVEITR